MIDSSQLAINQTIEWIKSVVIELNFCPFASKVFNNKSIRYVVLSNTDTQSALECLLNEFGNLDTKLEIETTLIIFSNDYKEYIEHIGPGKAIWYHKNKKLLNGETNTEIPIINTPFVPNYNAIQPGKI